MADDKLLGRLRTEQTKVILLEERINELEVENHSLKNNKEGELKWSEKAKLELLEDKINELNDECLLQTQRCKTIQSENLQLENNIAKTENDYLEIKSELQLVRNQLQIKSAKLITIETELKLSHNRINQLQDELLQQQNNAINAIPMNNYNEVSNKLLRKIRILIYLS